MVAQERPDLKPLARSVRASGLLREHARPTRSGGLQGVQWRVLAISRADRAKNSLRCGAYFALAERQYDACASIGGVRSDLSLLFAANPGESLAQVSVDTLCVTE